LEALIGEIRIGKRVHVASQVIIGAREPVVIGDYAAIAAGSKIYSNSEVPKDGLHMSGPMIPESMKAFSSREILIGKDALVGCNSVLLPGASLQEGAILGAQSLLKEVIPAWEIWGGVPARKIGERSHNIEMPNP
jgi:acetyltransferase-like isoleucine patch superfamily enzyme